MVKLASRLGGVSGLQTTKNSQSCFGGKPITDRSLFLEEGSSLFRALAACGSSLLQYAPSSVFNEQGRDTSHPSSSHTKPHQSCLVTRTSPHPDLTTMLSIPTSTGTCQIVTQPMTPLAARSPARRPTRLFHRFPDSPLAPPCLPSLAFHRAMSLLPLPTIARPIVTCRLPVDVRTMDDILCASVMPPCCRRLDWLSSEAFQSSINSPSDPAIPSLPSACPPSTLRHPLFFCLFSRFLFSRYDLRLTSHELHQDRSRFSSRS
jgi:hypothetical protein